MKFPNISKFITITISIAVATLVFASSPTMALPKEIKVGTLYAGTGTFSTPSKAQFEGLQFWAKHTNRNGGVYVKAFKAKLPVKIIAYDDKSSPELADKLYEKLIKEDKVNILASDFGSVLTAGAIPIAERNHVLLFDQTGSANSFFTKKTRYLADVSIPSSTEWPIRLGLFLVHLHVHNVAIIYDNNDFDISQAKTLKPLITGGGMTLVYYHAVPTSQSNYNEALMRAKQLDADAVIEFGYPNNDIAFFKSMAANRSHFKMVFTVFPGQLLSLIKKNVGDDILSYTYTYATPPTVNYKKVNLGMSTDDFVNAFKLSTGSNPNFLNTVGYNTGVIIQGALGLADDFSQESLNLSLLTLSQLSHPVDTLAFSSPDPALDYALVNMSSKTNTLLGNFRIDEYGSQLGEFFPIGQLIPEHEGNKIVVVYPRAKANAEAVYPAP